MDTDAAFREIGNLISEGRRDAAIGKIKETAFSSDDAMDSVKCLSMLKVLADAEASAEIAKRITETLPERREPLLQIAGALRGLDFPEESYEVLKRLETDDSVLSLRCLCLADMEEYELALDTFGKISEPGPSDRILKSEILSALGEHTASIENSAKLLEEMPGSFDARKAYVATLVLAGKDKDAAKYVRAVLKEKDSDANALAAYAMGILGNIKSAAGYATRALKIDPENISAMETLGICLARKGEYDKARIMAGAINEVSPGNRAAINVLTYCGE